MLDAIGESGFRFVEIGTPPRHFDPWSDDQVKQVAECLRRSGIDAVSIHAPFGGILDLSDPNPQHQSAAIGGILQAAIALQALGGSIVVVHPTDVPRLDQDVEQRLETASHGLARLASAVGRMGMRLAVESPLPHLIGGDPAEFERILAQLDDSAGVCLDTGHVTLGKNWDRFVRIAGTRLLHVHANDHRGSFDDHLPPGDGILHWGEISESLRRSAFAGHVILELSCPAGPVAEFLSRARSSAQALLGDGGTQSA